MAKIWLMRGVVRNANTGEETLVGTKDKDMPERLARRRLAQGGWRKMGEVETDAPEPIVTTQELDIDPKRPVHIPKGETVLPSSHR